MKVLAIVFIFLIVVLTIATVKKVIPDSKATKLNIIGYRTCCPFTPISTAIGLAVVIILLVVAKRMTLI